MNVLKEIWEEGVKKLGKVECQFVPPKVRAAHCRRAMDVAIPGSIICRKYLSHLTSALIPGEFSHSGVIESSQYIIHAIGEGVGREDILDFVKDCDGFIIVHPSVNFPYDAGKTIAYAREQLGKPYDFEFQAEDTKAFFCHELSARSLEAGGIKIVPELRVTAGIIAKELFLADQFITDHRMNTVYRTEF